MKILTKENVKKLPPLYSQENKGDNAIAYIKFFNPTGSQTWYITEYDQEDTFFGLYTDSTEQELGYFSLSELKAFKGLFGLGIERDMYFEPTEIKNLRK